MKSHKIRLNPTKEQEIYFRKAAGTARFVFNWGLATWKKSKEENPNVEYGSMAIKKEFNRIKGEQFSWVYEVSKSVCENSFFNLADAMKNYYDYKNRNRKGDKVGFVNFKSKKNKRQSFKLNNDRVKLKDHAIYVPKLGWVNMTENLRFEGRVVSITISSHANRWYVSISVEMPISLKTKKEESEIVGIDLGIKTLATLSNGHLYENKVLLRQNLNKLKLLNRKMSRQVHNSNRYYDTKLKLSRLYERISNQRNDYLHKMTTEIVGKYPVIGIETLNVKGMVKNRRLSLSLSDASMGEIKRQLAYKSQWNGNQLIAIDKFYPSSKKCSSCGTINRKLMLNDREWTCEICNTCHDRDLNASINIKNEAIRILNNKTPVLAKSGVTLVDRMLDLNEAFLSETRMMKVPFGINQ